MPNAPRTKTKAFRLDDELWEEAGDATAAVGLDRTAVVRAFLEWYVGRDGAQLPQRPVDVEPAPETAEDVLDEILARVEAYRARPNGKRKSRGRR